METINERIKNRRIELGMSQEELALKLGFKSRSSINKIELGRDIRMKYIDALAEALQCSVDYLMGWDDLEEDIETNIEKTKAVIQVIESKFGKEEADLWAMYMSLSNDMQIVIKKKIQAAYELELNDV